jgi:hypothetical protein
MGTSTFMKKQETNFILTKTLIIILIFNCLQLFSQENCDLFTYTNNHKVKGPKVYVTGFDTAANYTPSYNDLLEFIKTNIKTQLDEKNNHIQGKVFLSFIVEKNGSISDIKVIKGLSASCDAEALRVLSVLPNKWSPARKKGDPVRSQFNLSMSFN